MKKLIYLFALIPLLFGCASKPSEEPGESTNPDDSGEVTPPDDGGQVTPDPDEILFKKDALDIFYTAMKGHNFTADDKFELKQTFFGEDYVLIDIIGERQTGIARFGNQGIFTFFENNAKQYEVFGMLTPNASLSIYDGFNNATRLEYLPKGAWVKGASSGNYSLRNISSAIKDTLAESAFAGASDLNSFLSLTLSKDVKKKTLALAFEFKNTSGVANYTVTISNIGKNKNEQIENYINNTTVTSQTDWNEYQKEAFERYNIWNQMDIPFYTGFTNGLSLYFYTFSGISICTIYDYGATIADESGYARFLAQNGFGATPRDGVGGERKFAKQLTADSSLLATFRFISPTELDAINQEAFPNGYLQIVLSVGSPEAEIDLATANSKLAHAGLVSLESGNYTYITFYDIAKAIGNIADDEDYRAIYDAFDLPYDIPPYTDYFEMHLGIEEFSEACSIVNPFALDLINNHDFICSVEGFTKVENLSAYTFGLYKYDSDDKLDTAVYIDLYDTYGELNEYGKDVSIVVEKFSSTGKIIFDPNNE